MELWQFFPDPDRDPERTEDSRIRIVMRIVTKMSLDHTPALHKTSSKSVGNFFDNPVISDFGLRTQWSGSSPKLNFLVPGPCPTLPRNFVKIRSQLFQLSDGQTNRQTDRTKNITSFGGGNEPSNRHIYIVQLQWSYLVYLHLYIGVNINKFKTNKKYFTLWPI